jgi:hypothetical protein
VTGVARAVAPFSLGVDTLDPLSPAALASFKSRGVSFIGTYLPVLIANPGYRDAVFAQDLGIALLTVGEDGVLSGNLGEQSGVVAAGQASALGVPAGVHVTIDLEDDQGDPQGFTNAFAEKLVLATLRACLYPGQPCQLTAAELQALLPDRYWRSCSLGVPTPARQWSVLQLRPGNVADPETGARVDWDVVEADAEGDTPVLWWPS